MDVLLSTGNVLTEAVWKCQSWLESVTDASAAATHAAAAADAAAPLPWDVPAGVAADLSPKVRKALRDAVLALSQDKEVFLRESPAALATVLTPQLHASAGAALQEDAALQALRFRLVPRRVSEEQFWQRYFAAVAALRRRLLGSGSGSGSAGGSGGGGGGCMSRAMSERSSSTAAGMSVAAGSTSSPGQQLRWSTAADMKAAATSRLGKTLSQVSSLAAEALMLSPRSPLGDQAAAAAMTPADAAPPASPTAAAASATDLSMQPTISSRSAGVATAAVPAAPQGSGGTPVSQLLEQGASVLPAAAGGQPTAPTDAAAAAPLSQPAAGSRAGVADCASDDGDWSHCSDSFMDLSADVVSHDADWMVL